MQFIYRGVWLSELAARKLVWGSLPIISKASFPVKTCQPLYQPFYVIRDDFQAHQRQLSLDWGLKPEAALHLSLTCNGLCEQLASTHSVCEQIRSHRA